MINNIITTTREIKKSEKRKFMISKINKNYFLRVKKKNRALTKLGRRRG